MKTTRPTSPQIINAGHLLRRHPWNQSYATDIAYTRLANHIYSLLEEELSFMGKEAAIQVALGVTLYIEDVLSETHQMEAFMQLYRRMYGYALPFYDSSRETDTTPELDKMRFVLWHCSCAERTGKVLNPMNIGIKEMAKKMLDVVHSAQSDFGCRANEELADFLYAEETLADPIQVKCVIMWLESESFLGRWHNNRPEDDKYHFAQLAHESQKSMVRYANMSVGAFAHQAWPLSIPAKCAYAEMLRLDSGDADDPDAKEVEAIEFVDFRVFRLEGVCNGKLLVTDHNGRQYEVEPTSSSIDLRQKAKKCNSLAAALFKYQDQWNVCGANNLLKLPEESLEKSFAKAKKMDHVMNDFVGQYDEFIQAHGGQRAFYVKNNRQYQQWLKEELGMKNVDNLKQGMASYLEGQNYTIFFEDNGQITISQTAAAIQHPDNPYYDVDNGQETAFAMVVNEDICTPGLLEYALRNNLLPDATLSDMRGEEYGWQLMQENIDFMARCFRRDIRKQEVFCPRRDVPLPSNDEEPWEEEKGLLSLEDFLHKIRDTKEFVSTANKHWKLVKATQSVVSVKDDRRKVVEIDTDGLYEAYCSLESYEFVIDNIKEYVHRDQASAALAVLHTAFGHGAVFASLRKMFDRLGGIEGLSELLRNRY